MGEFDRDYDCCHWPADARRGQARIAELEAALHESYHTIGELRGVLEALQHGDGCYCDAALAPPGTHVRHTDECVAARKALEPAP